MRNIIASSCMLLALMTLTVQGHSWLHCADYTEENGQFFSESKCRAYPREFTNAFKYTSGNKFGADVGMDYRPSDSQACRNPNSGSSYDTTYPSAKYSPGQKVCVAWPPKNHVAAKCNNPYIPDSGTQIYRSGVNPTSDPTLSQFKQNLVYDFGKNLNAGDGTAFQNCPNFCADPGAALCTGCFSVPSNLALGKYTFMWLWAFNGPTDYYSTCFDVEIVANSGNKVTSVLPHYGPDAFKDLIAGTSTAAVTVAGGTTSPVSSVTGNNVATTGATTGNNVATTGATVGTNNGGISTSVNGPTPSPTFAPAKCIPIDPDCPTGSERCFCTRGGACDSGLKCASNLCVNPKSVSGVPEINDDAASLLPSLFVSFFAVVVVLWGLF